MPNFADLNRSRLIEYFMLDDAMPIAASIGTYAGKPIPAAVIDAFGRRYDYTGIAPRHFDGRFDLDALRTGEFILQPGLVYRYNRTRKHWWKALRQT